MDMEKDAIWESYEGDMTEDLLALLEQAEDIGAFTREHVDRYRELSFVGYLERLMAEKKLRRADVIRASGLSESFAYQIFAGYKNPSRDKLLALAVGMGLSREECQRLLRLGGAGELYPKNRRDAIILFGLRKNLSILQINDLLFHMEEYML